MDEHDVPQRVRVIRHAFATSSTKWRVLGEDGVDRFDNGVRPLLTLGFEPVLERLDRRHRLLHAFG